MRPATLLIAVAAAVPAFGQPPSEPDGGRGFFARAGDVTLTVGVFGPEGGGISSVGARYWVSDRVAVGAEAGEAALDVGDSDREAGLFPSYLTGTSTQSGAVWAERHFDTPARWASVTAGVRAYGGVQSRSATRHGFSVDCLPGTCGLVGRWSSAREEAVTGGVVATVGNEVRVFRGLTLGLASDVGAARTSARLIEQSDAAEPVRSNRAVWHLVRGGRLSVSVYL